MDIRTAHGTDRENAAAAALRAVLAEHDLRRWMFTDLVTIDETIRGGVSHPLTIGPGLLVQRPALALTRFLHEQLHWVEGPGTDSKRRGQRGGAGTFSQVFFVIFRSFLAVIALPLPFDSCPLPTTLAVTSSNLQQEGSRQ